MTNDAEHLDPEGPHPRFPLTTMIKALLPALAATVLVVLLISRSRSNAPMVRPDGMMRVTLSQKDSAFRPIPPSAGGATGVVWYSPKGPGLHFQLKATGLPANRRYLLELKVDDVIYTVASHSPDARGQLAIDTTITRFEEGVCVGKNFDPPRATSGHHLVKFWIKRDGSPASGTMPGIASGAPGAQLACHGNGDGNYQYVLLENEVADFTGTAETVPGRPQ
jgi:hypothetical protein